MKNSELKSIVKEKYGEIAKKSLEELGNMTCCGTQCCSSEPHDMTPFNDDYTQLAGYNKDADLKLGCGVPTAIAQIKVGDTVLDLGSGAGNDAFVARAIVGDSGKVIGLDMTEPMIEKSRLNAQKLGYKNVEFRLGDIEAMPIENESVDVVISNCVLNLVPNKKAAFVEIFRVLKKWGHFSISDIVLERELPEGIKKAAEMYAGCVSGAVLRSEYLQMIKAAGFSQVEVKLSKPITLPTSVLNQYLSPADAAGFAEQAPAISSITVFGKR
jgi:SAM-dependent methyltransferase